MVFVLLSVLAVLCIPSDAKPQYGYGSSSSSSSTTTTQNRYGTTRTEQTRTMTPGGSSQTTMVQRQGYGR